MSKDTLKSYVVIGRVANINAGLLQLTGTQAKPRLYGLKPVDVDATTMDGVYEVTQSLQFKAGETIGYDGHIPKAMADVLVSPEQAAIIAQQILPATNKKEKKSTR